MTIGHNGGPVLQEESPIRIRVVRIHINDWVASTRGLSLEQEGFFWRFHLLLYDRMGVLIDDDAHNARAMSCDIRTYRRVKEQLLELKKLYLEDGHITHPRVIREIEQFVAEHRRRSSAAKGREERAREDRVERVADEMRATSAEDQADFQPTSAELPAEVRAISGRSSSELSGHISKIANEINGCTATTVTTSDPRPSRARAFPKPKPKPLEEYIDPETGHPLEEAFNQFWNAYPKHVAKQSALKCFVKIVTGRHGEGLHAKVAELIEGAERLSEYVRAKGKDPEFVKHPATWLNAAGWLDEMIPRKPPWWAGRTQEQLAGLPEQVWRKLVTEHANGVWDARKICYPPGHPKCPMPQQLIDDMKLMDLYGPSQSHKWRGVE